MKVANQLTINRERKKTAEEYVRMMQHDKDWIKVRVRGTEGSTSQRWKKQGSSPRAPTKDCSPTDS
jgi:hypothetical protein